jgi:hypothetical protein
MGITSENLYNIINGDKSQSNVASADTVNSQNLYNIIKGPAVEKESTPWSDVLTRAITNTPKSAVEFGRNIYQAVTNPLDTIEGVARLAVGAGHSLKPEHIASWIEHSDWDKKDLEKSIETAKTVGDLYKNRYGSVEGFKEAVATDPVGVASDLATILSGGAGLANKTGVVSKATELAGKVGASPEALATAGKVAENLNPVTATGNLAAGIGKPFLGGVTGTSPETIARSALSGFEGDTSYINQLRGNAPINAPLDAARANLNTMRQTKNNAYRSGMVDITGDKSVLNFNDIDKALKEAKDSISFKNQKGDKTVTAIHQELADEINNWKKLNPAEYHTPEGLDFLKKKIGDITNRIPYEEANANRIGSDIYNSVKNTISAQAPKYAEVMSDYHEASDTIKEIEKALKLGNKASSDTAMRALQSVSRNNVNTNYGQRLTLAQQLEKEGGRPFINALAGQAMSSPNARGLAGTVQATTGLAGLYNPFLLGLQAIQSPRLVGEALYAGGRGAKAISNLSKKTGINQARGNTLADILQNINKAKEEE